MEKHRLADIVLQCGFWGLIGLFVILFFSVLRWISSLVN